jgi:hypothetical protein
MSFLSSKSSKQGKGKGSGFNESNSLNQSTLTKGVHMTLLKSMWKSVMLMSIAGVLVFAGGALAAGASLSLDWVDGKGTQVYNGTLPTAPDAEDVSAVLIDTDDDDTPVATCVGTLVPKEDGVALTKNVGSYPYTFTITGCVDEEDESYSTDETGGELDFTVTKKTLVVGDFDTDGVPTSGETPPAAGDVTLNSPLDKGALVWDIVYGDENAATPTAGAGNAVKLKITTVDGNYANTANSIIPLGVTYTAPTASSVTSVTVSPAAISVALGDDQAFEADVVVTGSAAKTVTWTIETAGIATNTTISTAGVLTVASDETKTTLTIKATSTVDATKSGTATVTVVDPSQLTDAQKLALAKSNINAAKTGWTPVAAANVASKEDAEDYINEMLGDVSLLGVTTAVTISGFTAAGTSAGTFNYSIALSIGTETPDAVTGTVAITAGSVEPPPAVVTAVTAVKVSPVTVVVSKPDAGKTEKYTFTATVEGTGNYNRNVTWNNVNGTGVSGAANGNTYVVTVTNAVSAGFTVTATSVGDNASGGKASGSVTATFASGTQIAGTLSITNGTNAKVGYVLTAVANVTAPKDGALGYVWRTGTEQLGYDTLAKSGGTYTPKWADYGKAIEVVVTKGTATTQLKATSREVEADTLAQVWLLNSKKDVPYSASNTYTIDGPKVSSDAGTIDTVIYEVTGSSGAVLGKVDTKGSKFAISKVGIGNITLKAVIRGKKSNVPWRIEVATVAVEIVPKKLSSSDVTFATISGKTAVYKGARFDDADDTPLMVKDGSVPLKQSEDFKVESGYRKCADGLCNDIYAGDAYLVITGGSNGFYSKADTAVGKYTIGKAPLTVIASKFDGKQYDGTNAVKAAPVVHTTDGGAIVVDTAAALEVDFPGFVKANFGAAQDSVLKLTRDFTISNAIYSSKEVGTGLTGTATVALTANGLVSKNYTLANGSISRGGIEISKRDIASRSAGQGDSLFKGDTMTFKYARPVHYDMSKSNPSARRGIGPVTLKDPITNTGGTLTVLYSYATTPADFNKDGVPFTGDTTRAPIKAGSYLVKVRIGGNGPNIAIPTGDTSVTVNLGVYYIEEPVHAVVVDEQTDITVRQGRTATLSVSATSPNNGVLSYQWLEEKDNGTDVKVGTNSNTFTAPTSSMGTRKYKVVVTNSKSGVQDPVSDTTSAKTVEVIEPPTTLNSTNAFVVLSKSTWTYNGYQQALGGSDVLVRFIKKDANGVADTVTLDENKDYTLAYTNAVNVGTATLRVTGKDDYAGSLTKTFTIAKKEVEAFDFTMVEERAYTGDSLGAQVRLITPLTNSGSTVTVYYDDGNGKKTAIPANVGNYDVIIDVTAGANLTAGTDIYLGSYVITKGVLDTACFRYTIPVGHNESTTTNFGIGAVTWKKGSGYGSFTILYNGDTTVPRTGGVYTVTADVTGGANFDEGGVVLGEYAIAGVSVKGGDRVVPGTGAKEVAAVAPVKAAVAVFTAGPSPVSKNGTIKFFSANQVKSGSLYIFDATGKSVAKVGVKAGTGAIGSWSVGNAAEGSYIVKGVLAGKDGTREKVSFVFSVVK